MKKIPVLDTIRYGYGFTLGHLGTIIGLIWLPMVILAIAGYFVMSYYYGSVPDAVSAGNAAAVGQSGLLVMGWSIVSLLLSSIMYVAVTRQALGLREGPAIVHFSLGPPELRVFGAMLGFFAIMIAFLIAAMIFLSAASALAAKMPGGKILASLVALAVLAAVAYAGVRLSFLLIPATVAEDKIGLGRAWTLSSGNFWRMVGVGVATLGPIAIVALVAEFAILGPEFFLHQAASGAGSAQQMQQTAEQMRAAAKHLPLLYGLSFLMAPFLTGLALAPAAFAYRALADAERSGPALG